MARSITGPSRASARKLRSASPRSEARATLLRGSVSSERATLAAMTNRFPAVNQREPKTTRELNDAAVRLALAVARFTKADRLRAQAKAELAQALREAEHG